MARSRSRLGRITRRVFLFTGAAMAGGVAFGVWQARRELPNPLSAGPGRVPLNPWVVIRRDGVTIVTGRAEMGQGSQTTLAALAAEELDVDWRQVRAEHGPPAPAYYNGALIAAGLPFPDHAETTLQSWLRRASFVLPKMLALQVTGGSTAMIDGFDKLRIAGAAARESLRRAAARRLGVRVETLTTREGHVIAPDGTRIPYGELLDELATVEPPRRVRLRPRREWRLLGRALPRLDQVAKVTGTAEFGIDVRLPGMLHASVRRAPGLGASLISFEDGAARAMPGVVDVVPLPDGLAVVATNSWLAMQAAEAVEARWSAAPYPADTPAQFARILEAFDRKPNAVLREHGDVARAPGTPIEAEYRVPFLAHATMEPMNATARLVDGRLEVWAPTQAPLLARDKAAEAVGLAPEDVTIHVTLLGGGFGRRAEFDFVEIAARVAAAIPGRAVQVLFPREEDMTHDFYRPAAVARMRGHVARGRITGFDARVAAPSVTRQSVRRIAGFVPPGPDKTLLEGLFDQPYRIPNLRVAGHVADLEVPVGYWRSVGNSMNAFFHECFVDELAHAAGADPLAFRLAHIREAHPPSARVLEAVGELAGWGADSQPGTARGVAFCRSFGTSVAQVIEVSDSPAGIRVTRAWIACDPGLALDPGIIEAQMISGLVFGLSAAIHGRITFADGAVEQQNFPDYEVLRMHTCPEVRVRILEQGGRLGGIGEPGTPPAAPALANALFALTGRRVRELPLASAFDFAG